MLWKYARAGSAAALAGLSFAVPASAQATGSGLLALDGASLRAEVQSRFDEALGLTADAAVVSADSNRYMWASQAKAQCGIALGFLKSGTRDAVSLGKCADAADRMRMAPLPAAPATLPAVATARPAGPLPEACTQRIAGIVFFDWDSDTAPESAGQTLDSVVNYAKLCSWNGLAVAGHTDRSGSDRYNDALSHRRARAVAALLEGRGLPMTQVEVTGQGESAPKVPTIDGERNPTNRRVEITVK